MVELCGATYWRKSDNVETLPLNTATKWCHCVFTIGIVHRAWYLIEERSFEVKCLAQSVDIRPICSYLGQVIFRSYSRHAHSMWMIRSLWFLPSHDPRSLLPRPWWPSACTACPGRRWWVPGWRRPEWRRGNSIPSCRSPCTARTCRRPRVMSLVFSAQSDKKLQICFGISPWCTSDGTTLDYL